MTDLLRLTWTFLWLSLLAVGGGLGMLAEMQRQVTAHGWVTARAFVEGYTLSQLTPGPNMLIAVFVGYHAHGVLGALLAGLAMFLPSAILTALVCRRWSWIRRRPWAMAAERALAPVGLGLMAAGVYTLARSSVHDVWTAAFAGIAVLVLARGWLPPVLVVLLAGLAAAIV